MTQPPRTLVPVLALLVATLADAGTIQGFETVPPPPAKAGFLLEPREDLPRRWDLPEGWTSQTSQLDGGGLVEDLRGPKGEGAWARVFSWPAPLGRVDAYEARRMLLEELRPGYQLARHSRKGDEIELLMVGWLTSEVCRTPDVVALARCAGIGDRLVAAVGGVDVGDPEADEAAARDLLSHLRLGDDL
jgi:hypothetical protein